MANEEIIASMIDGSPNRRSFVQKLGLAGAALGAVALTRNADAQSAITDVDILNFALNLEYLEAEFYTVATQGRTIDQLGFAVTGSGTAGATTGGFPVAFSTTDNTVMRVALEIATEERAHVNLLRAAITGLGGQPIARPAINLGALGFGFSTQAEFLRLARIFEDIGVTAYGGAAPLIRNSSILGYAARILATEALHAGNIRCLIDRYGVTTAALDAVDYPAPPSGPKFFSTNSDSITEIRTPGQVLFLAYAAANARTGGFFPSGVNGNLNTSSAAAATSDGTFLSANPSPVRVAAGQIYGTTTISWSAPFSNLIEIHVNAPNGPLFTRNFSSGSMQTQTWVIDGMTFYLQDVSGGKALTAANTLATLMVRVTN